jgi:hypothetical protein
MLTITRFKHHRDTSPKTSQWTCEDASYFFRPQFVEVVSKEKRSEVFSMNIYKEGTSRGKANVQEMTGLVFDFDNKDDFIPIQDVLNKINQHNIIYYWYTTHSSTAELPRWRLVIPFSTNVPISNWETIYNQSVYLIGNPPGIDHPASKDVARMWYIPYKHPDHPFEASCNLDGQLLHPDNIKDLLSPEDLEKLEQKKEPLPSKKKTDPSLDVWPILRTLNPNCEYQTWIKIGMALHHHFNGSLDGFSTWDKWSAFGASYPGTSALLTHWTSFGNHSKPITFAGVVHMARNLGYIIEPLQEKTELKAINIRDFMGMSFPPIQMLLDPIISSQGLTMLYAPRGIGKTFLSLWISYAIAAGKSMFEGKWETSRQHKILFVDGEMPSATLQDRLGACLNFLGPIDTPERFTIITRDPQAREMPDLSTIEGQKDLDPHLEGVSLLILDNLSSLLRSGEENEASSWKVVQEWLLSLRARGISVLLVHHANKSGSQRGTSKREDILDTIISLKHPKDYQPEQGARFEVHYEKTRGFHGEKAKPFEVWLKNGSWEVSETLADTAPRAEEVPFIEKYADVINLRKEGLSIRAIADRLKLSKSNAARIVKKIERLELLPLKPET